MFPRKTGNSSKAISPMRVDQNASGILAGLFRRVIIDLNLAHEQSGLTSHWFAQLDRYLNDPSNGSYADAKERQSVRGGLQKELFKPFMSWKVFIKGLRVAGLKKITFSIEFETRVGKSRVISIPVETGIDGPPDNIDED